MSRYTDRFGNTTKKGITPGGRKYSTTKTKDGSKLTDVWDKNTVYTKASSSNKSAPVSKASSKKGAIKKGPTTKAKK